METEEEDHSLCSDSREKCFLTLKHIKDELTGSSSDNAEKYLLTSTSIKDEIISPSSDDEERCFQTSTSIKDEMTNPSSDDEERCFQTSTSNKDEMTNPSSDDEERCFQNSISIKDEMTNPSSDDEERCFETSISIKNEMTNPSSDDEERYFQTSTSIKDEMIGPSSDDEERCFQTSTSIKDEMTGPNSDKEERCSAASIQDLISGEVYDRLCKTFLATGKGRRPDPPKVPKNYKALLMLDTMREQGNRSNSVMFKWFETLFPDIPSQYPMVRLRGKINSVSSIALKLMGTDALQDFVLTPLNLESVSPCLDSFGINLHNIFNPLDFQNTIIDKCHVTNQLIVDLVKFKNKERPRFSQFVSQWVLKLLNYQQSDMEFKKALLNCNKLVEKTVKQHTKILGKKRRAGNAELNQFLSSKFDLELQIRVSEEKIKSKEKKLLLAMGICGECKILREEIVSLTDIVTTIQNEKSALEKKLKDLESRSFRNYKEALAKKIRKNATIKCQKLSELRKKRIELSKKKSKLKEKIMTKKLNTINKINTILKRDVKISHTGTGNDEEDINIKLLKSKAKIKKLKLELNSLKLEFSKVLPQSGRAELSPSCFDFKGGFTNVNFDSLR